MNEVNYERHRTRDLLLEYDIKIMPPLPCAAKLNIIYPWENTSLQVLISQLYQIANMNGFIGTQQEFLNKFSNYVSDKEIIFETYDNFPEIGSNDKLYFDLNEKILYYWDQNYMPVNTMLITDTLINGGEA